MNKVQRLYQGPIKQGCQRMGIHSTLSSIYNNKYKIYHPIYRYLFDPLDREKLRRECDELYEFSSDEEIIIQEPSYISQNSINTRLSDSYGQYFFKRPFVAEIHNARILPELGIATTSECSLLLETANSRESKIPLSFEGRLDTLVKTKCNVKNDISDPDKKVDMAFSLIRAPYTRPHKNYSHWVQCHLTLLEGIETYTNITNKNPKVIIEKNPPSWLIQSLYFYGYHESDVLIWEPASEIEVDRLIVPSVRRAEETLNNRKRTGDIYKLLSPNACKWLKNKSAEILETESRKKDKKIFIDRSDAGMREIWNKNEILPILEDRGFDSYILSELSFEKQVKLFSRAEKIVGVTGAGLANMIFSDRCDVVMIFGEQIKNTYHLLSEVCGHDNRVVIGKNVENEQIPKINQDIYVNEAKLIEALEN